jgi:hypothetical protein
VCGITYLQGIAGVAIPNAQIPEPILGNIWDRTNMMGAAQTAFRLGFVDAAVNVALCSQIHNPPVQSALAQRRYLIAAWFGSR